MRHVIVHHVTLAAVGVLAVVGLAGCSAESTPPIGTVRPSASTGGTAPAAAPTSGGGPGAATPAAPATGTGEGTAAGDGTGRCTTASLAGGTAAGSGGAAGSMVVHLTLRNTGSAACTLQGWPGVSFVGGGDGAQIGAAAGQDRSSAHPTVTLQPGQTAVAPLKIANAQDYAPAECTPTAADGFRVYPPGSTESLFVPASGYTACSSASAGLLQVQALVPEGQATD